MPNPTLNSNVLCSSTGGAWSTSIVVASSLVSPVLVLIGNCYNGGGTPAFTLGAGGTAFTLFVRRVYSSGRTAGIWYIINPAPGTYTLTQTAGSASGNLRATVWENVDQTTPLANAAQADGFGNPTLNVTVPTNGVAIDCIGFHYDDTAITAQGSGQTLVGNDGNGSTFNAAASSYEAASGTVVMDWAGGSESAHVGAALQYSAGSGSTFNVARDESLTATDAQSASAVFAPARAETLTAAETETATAAFSTARAETLTAAEAATGTLTAPVAATEALTAAESTTGALTAAVARAESLSATDSQDANVVGAAEQTTESLTATATQTATVVFAAARSETLAASDAPTSTFVVLAALAETLGASDSALGSYATLAAIAEALALADAQTGTIPGAFVTDASELVLVPDNGRLSLLPANGRLLLIPDIGALAPLPDD